MLDIDRRLTALAASQHWLLTRRQAADEGLSWHALDSRIRRGILDEPVAGVLRVRAAPPTDAQAVRLATLAGGGHAVASHRAAAALHHLDGFGPGLIEVSVPRPRRLELPRVVVHHVQAPPPEDLTVIGGIPVTGLARTLCDLGTVVNAHAVERALDDARRRGTSLRWLRETAERLHRPGQAGTKTLLLLLDTAEQDRGVRGSWFEKLVEECLRSPDLPPLVRQHRVHDATGALAGILDLAFPTIRLGVEAHSRQFHFGRDAEQRDEDRDHRLARCGWEVLYVGWQLAKRPKDVLALVRDTARHRAHLLQTGEV